ncbi:MAG: hypothetical protein HDQ99_02910 [Lachnospiraceae bacterium]|nr:hypothetical protein [Lachnospiraceae bacterium]
MNRNVTVKINTKGVKKKLEKITHEKYPPTYVPPEHNENELPYSPPQWYTPKSSMFMSANKYVPYSPPMEDIPFDHHKIKCPHCENVISIPMGYSHCPECDKIVYADKNTVFLL